MDYTGQRSDQMKQHIDSKDVATLTTETFIKLSRIMYNERERFNTFDKVASDLRDAFKKSKGNWFALQEWLTIGKIIEILGDKLGCIDFDGLEYHISIDVDPIAEYFEDKELADALFKAVKYVLGE